jgi:hypothetical protein
MPTYSIDGPDGKTYSIDGPAGATREQVIAQIQARMTPQKEAPYTGQILPFSRDEQGQTHLAVPGFMKGIVDAAKAPGDVYSGKLQAGSPEAESAARDVAGLVAGGGAGGKPKDFVANPASGALDRLGADVKGAKTADTMQNTVKGTIGAAKQDIAGAPAIGDRELAEQVGKGLGEQYSAVKGSEAQAHNLAKEIGETVDVRGISNIDDVRRIVGQYAGQLKKQGTDLAQGLRGEKLKGEREILDLREEIHNMQQADLAGEDLSDLDKAKLDLRAKRLENAQAQLTHKEGINANLNDQVKEAEATEKQYAKGGLPKEIHTGRDLIELKQFLNSVDPQKLSAVEVSQLKQQKETVDAALQEAGKVGTDISNAGKLPLTPGGPPKFSEQLAKANKLTEINAERYGGDAAKQLGVDKALLAATKKGAREGVDKHALSNIIAGVDNFPARIKNTGHVDWLRENLPKKDFDQLMANKLNDILEKVGTDPKALTESRELIDHILGPGIGLKGQKLTDLQTVFKELEAANVDLKMSPERYRNVNGLKARATNLLKSLFTLGKSGASSYAIEKGVKAATGPNAVGEAERLMQLRKELLKKPPSTIPGAAIGSVVGSGQMEQQ